MTDAAGSPRNEPESALERIARWIYSLVWLPLLPAMMLYLLYRGRQLAGYRRHWGERFGFFGRLPGPAPLIWIHAVSVGETRAVQPIIRQLRRLYPDHQLLLTGTTPTGRAAAASLYADKGVLRCYLPYDFPWCVGRFLDHFQPALGILMETELWPNLMAGAGSRGIPVALINARLSEKSQARGQKFSLLIRPAIRKLTVVLAQTERDRQRLNALGCSNVQVAGNLKFDALLPDDLLATGRRWRTEIPGRNVVLLASSRDGEEAPVISAWAAHGPRHPVLMIVPRHPERFDLVAGLLDEAGLRLVRRSQSREFEFDGQDCILGDSMGEMPAYYAAADLAIMGGSLLPFGGQNLIEACAAGVPVILGPHTYNFEEAAEQAVACGAAVRVADAQAAVGQALALLANPAELEKMSSAATEFSLAHRGATVKTVSELTALLD